MPYQVHQIRGVAAVQHRECRVQRQIGRILPEQPVGDGMERPGPGHSDVDGTMTGAGRGLTDDAPRTLGHLPCGSPRESQQENSGRVHVLEYQMGHPVGQRHGLAGAGAGDNEQGTGTEAIGRAFTVQSGLPLGGIQLSQVVIVDRCLGHRTDYSNHLYGFTVSRATANDDGGFRR